MAPCPDHLFKFANAVYGGSGSSCSPVCSGRRHAPDEEIQIPYARAPVAFFLTQTQAITGRWRENILGNDEIEQILTKIDRLVSEEARMSNACVLAAVYQCFDLIQTQLKGKVYSLPQSACIDYLTAEEAMVENISSISTTVTANTGAQQCVNGQELTV